MTQLLTPSVESLWRQFADALRRFIRSRVGDPATAEDILQEVFLKLLHRPNASGRIANLEAWLFRTARNGVIDHFRTRKATVEIPDTLADADAEVSGEEAELVELKAAFRRMIFSLPEPYRDAVVLADLEGMAQADVAARLGISLSGAKSRVQRGRAQLRIMLDACCSFEFDRRGSVIDCTPRQKAACNQCGADEVF